MGKNGSWKTWHNSPYYNGKGSGNKGGSYTSTYAPGIDSKKNLKDNYESLVVTVVLGHINETTTPCLPTVED